MSKKIHQHNNGNIKNNVFPSLTAKSNGKRRLTGISLMLILPWTGSAAWAALPGGTLDPATIPKYATPLYVPPAMPKVLNGGTPDVDYYEIAARQITQQVLPKPLPKTTAVGIRCQK